MKYSRQREMIYEVIKENPIHPTADEVYSQLKVDHPELSLGTVYRNLNVLSNNGQLRRIPVPYGAERFDANTEEHLHMVCESCGHLEDVFLEEPERVLEMLRKETGLSSLSRYSLLLYGECSECRRKKRA